MAGEPKPTSISLSVEDLGPFSKNAVVDSNGSYLCYLKSFSKGLDSLSEVIAMTLDPLIRTCPRTNGGQISQDEHCALLDYMGVSICAHIITDLKNNRDSLTQIYDFIKNEAVEEGW